MKIIVHAGPPKCGTSGIQDALQAAASDLAAQRVYYHKTDRLDEWSLMYLYSAADRVALPEYLKAFFETREAALEWSRGCWAEFEQALDKVDCDYVVISSEHFANLGQKAAFIERLSRRFDDIYMIAYARDPLSLYTSALNQEIRGGASWSQLTAPGTYRYQPMISLRAYAPLLGPDRLIIRNFSRDALRGGNPVEDCFGEIIRITGADIQVPHQEESSNSSLCGAATGWLLTVNQAWDRAGMNRPERQRFLRVRRALIRQLREAEALRGLPPLSFKGTPVETVVRHNCRRQISWLNEHYLHKHHPLPEVDANSALPTQDEALAALRQCLLGSITAETMGAVGQVLLSADA